MGVVSVWNVPIEEPFACCDLLQHDAKVLFPVVVADLQVLDARLCEFEIFILIGIDFVSVVPELLDQLVNQPKLLVGRLPSRSKTSRTYSSAFSGVTSESRHVCNACA